MFLLSLIFSGLGIGVIAAVLIGLAIFAFVRGWTHIALGLAVATAAHIYSGSIYQAGEAACAARVALAVAAEQERQAEAKAAALAVLETQLDAAQASEADAERLVAAYEIKLAARPPVKGCILDAADAEAINGR